MRNIKEYLKSIALRVYFKPWIAAAGFWYWFVVYPLHKGRDDANRD